MLNINQKELALEFNAGRDFILNYRSVYEIVCSHGCRQFITRKLNYSCGNTPLTKRGRYVIADRYRAEKIMNIA